ncbi:hypothetical protein [Lentilitoribacter sp. EG35]|uniref:hypothetical protein n=1 Tax=Lentilitoribacter sp. EG35 TaxID=3234192 RepID=UPI0034608DF9
MTYEEALENYKTLAESEFGEKVKGKANPYTSINGNMFSFLDKEGTLCLRLSKADLANFMAEHDVPPVKQYGAVMKDYVSIPHPVLDDQKRLKEVFGKCLDNAKSLPAKPTKKKN